MRIAFALAGRPRPDSANGVELQTFRLAETLGRMDHRVLVASITHRQPIPIPNAEVRVFTPGRMPFRAIKSLERAMSSWMPDVVLIPSVYSPVVTRLTWFLRTADIPYIVNPNGGLGLNNERVHKLRKRIYKTLFELPMLDHSLFVWSVGDEADIHSYGTKSEIVNTRKGLDFPSVTLRDRHEVNLLEGIESRLLFGFVGRLDPVHKGLDLALEGFAKAGLPGAAMILVGPHVPGSEEFLKKTTARAGLDSQVRLGSPLFGEDRDAFVSVVDVFFHVSRWEGGVPYAVIEAAALGRPLLLSRQADPAGLLEGNRASLTVELTPDSISSAMRRFAEMSEQQRTEMGRRASDTVRREFGWDKMAGDLVDALMTAGVGR